MHYALCIMHSYVYKSEILSSFLPNHCQQRCNMQSWHILVLRLSLPNRNSSRIFGSGQTGSIKLLNQFAIHLRVQNQCFGKNMYVIRGRCKHLTADIIISCGINKMFGLWLFSSKSLRGHFLFVEHDDVEKWCLS